jgi:hypothetical protein
MKSRLSGNYGPVVMLVCSRRERNLLRVCLLFVGTDHTGEEVIAVLEVSNWSVGSQGRISSQSTVTYGVSVILERAKSI